MRKLGKKGNILVGNVVFIVLNVVFLVIVLLFLFSRMSSSAGMEEKYAKQIALMIDAAKPGMEIHNKMSDAFSKAENNGLPLDQVVSVADNIVTVKVREGAGTSYSFFNDVNVNAIYSPAMVDGSGRIVSPNKYVFVVTEK